MSRSQRADSPERFGMSPFFAAGPELEPGHVRRLAGVVTTPERFAERELNGSDEVCRYETSEAGLAFHLRHGSKDLGILDEIFVKEYYELPEPVSRLLGGSDRPLEAVDLGANIGLFGVWLLEHYPDAEITGFEPDPANVELLQRSIEANGLERRWRTVEACASSEDGSVPFLAGDLCGSRIVDGDEADRVASVPAVDVFPYLDDADLLKMDIEGGEWPILDDPRLADSSVRAISMEYHPHLCPEDDPRNAAERRLTDAGYATEVLFDRPDAGMLWAWREDGAPRA